MTDGHSLPSTTTQRAQMTCLALSVPIVSLSLIFFFIFLFIFLFFLQANNDVYNLGSIYAHRGRQRRNKTQMT